MAVFCSNVNLFWTYVLTNCFQLLTMSIEITSLIHIIFFHIFVFFNFTDYVNVIKKQFEASSALTWIMSEVLSASYGIGLLCCSGTCIGTFTLCMQNFCSVDEVMPWTEHERRRAILRSKLNWTCSTLFLHKIELNWTRQGLKMNWTNLLNNMNKYNVGKLMDELTQQGQCGTKKTTSKLASARLYLWL